MKSASLLFGLIALLLASSCLLVDAAHRTKHDECVKLRNTVEGGETVQARTYQQRLDHYNHQDDRTWSQRYWVEDRYWSGAANKGPIFLQLGGEGPENSGIVTATQMSVYAQTHKALQVGVEHRYYGQSQPRPDWTTGNLQWLSSQQALADAAELILYVRNTYQAYDSPIITFGCSYSGALAAFFRLKYPHITLGSVASSAPVEATYDFYQYLDVVDQSLSYFVGPACDNAIQQATTAMQTLLQTPSGQREIESKFRVCQPLNGKKDISTLMQNIMGNWQGQVQYNNEGPGYNVTTLCNQLTSAIAAGSTPLDAYATVNNQFIFPATCLDCNYQNQVAAMRKTNVDPSQNMRQWTLQCCTEFSYWQTTDSSSKVQPFGDLVPVQYWVDFCLDSFGVDFQVELKVQQTNQHYGGNKLPTFTQGNLLFVNGNIDPWHSLSVFEPIPGSPIETVFINGTAHCADVSLVGPNRAPPQLLAAQQQISNIIGKWLANYKPRPSRSKKN